MNSPSARSRTLRRTTLPLLRYQTVLAWRSATSTPVLMAGGLTVMACVTMAGIADTSTSMTIVLLGFGFALCVPMTMVATLGGVAAIRWSNPVSGRTAYRSYILFWFLLSVLPGLLYGLQRWWGGGAGAGLREVLALIVSSALLGAGIAGFAAVCHAANREWTLLRGAVVVGSVLVAGNLFTFAVVAFAGRGPSWEWTLVPVPMCLIGVALGDWMLLNTVPPPPPAPEGVEVASPGATGQRGRPAGGTSAGYARESGLSPIVGIQFGTWATWWTAFYVVTGVAHPLMFEGSMAWVGLLWIVSAGTGLTRIAMHAGRWLLAGPVSRSRAFRMTMTPVLGAVLLMATLNAVVSVRQADVGAFYRPMSGDHLWRARHRLLTVNDLAGGQSLWENPESLEPAAMADVVSRHLAEEFDVTVPTERVEVMIRRGRPSQPGPWPVVWTLEEADAAMERVKGEVGEALRASDQRRAIATSALAVLLALLLIRFNCNPGEEDGNPWKVFRGLALILLAFLLLVKGPTPMLAMAGIDSWSSFGLMLAVAAALGVWIWRSTQRSFAGLEYTDLPAQLSGPRRKPE